MKSLRCDSLRIPAITGAAILGFVTGIAIAAEPPYPSRPIRLLVGFSPGGASDVVARILGRKLTDT